MLREQRMDGHQEELSHKLQAWFDVLGGPGMDKRTGREYLRAEDLYALSQRFPGEVYYLNGGDYSFGDKTIKDVPNFRDEEKRGGRLQDWKGQKGGPIEVAAVNNGFLYLFPHPDLAVPSGRVFLGGGGREKQKYELVKSEDAPFAVVRPIEVLRDEDNLKLMKDSTRHKTRRTIFTNSERGARPHYARLTLEQLTDGKAGVYYYQYDSEGDSPRIGAQKTTAEIAALAIFSDEANAEQFIQQHYPKPVELPIK